MNDFSFEDFNFGSGNDEYDFSGLSDTINTNPFIEFGTDVQELDLSSLLGGDGGVDLSALDMGPEAFDINSLIDNFDNFSLEEGQGTQDISDLFDSFSLEGGQGTQDMSDLFDSFSLEGDQGFKFDDDTEPGSSGGTQGSYGPAGEGDLGSYEGSSYSGTGGGGSRSVGGGNNKLVFDDDREPGSSGGSSGSTGVAGSGSLGSYKGSTYDDSGGTKTKIDDKGNVILPDGTKVTPGGTVISPGTKTGPGGGTKTADKKDNNMLLMLLALMAMMNKGGGDSKGSGAVIPSLSADRKQLPYGPTSGSKARPGAGGVSYFSPTTYTQKAAGGGLMSLAGNGIARYAGNEGSLVGGDAALEAYQRGDYKTANDLLGKAGMGAQDVVSKYGLSQADAATVAKNLGYAGDMSGIKYAAPPVNQTANVQNLPVIPDDNASNTSYEKVGLGTFRGRPIINPADTDAQISNYYDKNKNLFDSKDYNKIASDMFVNEFTPEALARVKGFDQKAVTDLYNKTYGAFDRATQENLVNQKYKKQFGLTDKQLGEIGFGANVFSGEDRPENIRLNNAYGRYQDELAAAGRYDAPADAYYRTKAVYKPDERGRKNGRIELIDTVTGQQLTSFGAGQKSGQIFGLLDKFGVDPTSFKNAFKTAVDLPNNSGYRKDDYDSLMGYKARNLSGKTDEYLTKPLKNLTVGDLKPKYEKDDNNRQTADSKINVFYQIPMTNLLKSKGLSGNEASKLLSQFRPVAGLVNFAEISRSKDPVKAMIGTLNTLQSKGLINLDPNTGPLSKIGQSRFDAAGKKLPARYKGTESLQSLGLKGLASGGISSFAQSNQMSNLGGYSDGGRLLRGPGDGVSDSIPATIGGKQPARLAEGEFVVPARIVSELGNGSTNAGAQKLYAMMDRVQNARRKTKNVAANTKAHKYLPA